MKTRTEIFDMDVNGKPVKVKATLYQMHTQEYRYRVSINGSPVHIFAWDDDAKRLVAVDKGRAADRIPEEVETAIGRRLNSRVAA